MLRRRWVTVTGAALVALAATACGGDPRPAPDTENAPTVCGIPREPLAAVLGTSDFEAGDDSGRALPVTDAEQNALIRCTVATDDGLRLDIKSAWSQPQEIAIAGHRINGAAEQVEVGDRTLGVELGDDDFVGWAVCGAVVTTVSGGVAPEASAADRESFLTALDEAAGCARADGVPQARPVLELPADATEVCGAPGDRIRAITATTELFSLSTGAWPEPGATCAAYVETGPAGGALVYGVSAVPATQAPAPATFAQQVRLGGGVAGVGVLDGQAQGALLCAERAVTATVVPADGSTASPGQLPELLAAYLTPLGCE